MHSEYNNVFLFKGLSLICLQSFSFWKVRFLQSERNVQLNSYLKIGMGLKRPESAPVHPATHVQLSVRTLAKDTSSDRGRIEEARGVEETKMWNKNSNILQGIFRSPETSLLEVQYCYLIKLKYGRYV